MQTYRIESVVSSDHVLMIHGVPFRAGERVEIIVVPIRRQERIAERYPLRGTSYEYTAPFDSGAENDWATLISL